MPAPLMTRDQAIERLEEVFRREGYSGASIKTLSAASGLGASSLYNHFPRGKEDMAGAVLDNSIGWLTRHVIEVLNGPGAPRDRIRAAARQLDVFYGGGTKDCLVDLFSAGEAGRLFNGRIGAGIGALIAAFAKAAVDAGVPPAEAERRGEAALAEIQGALVMSRAMGRRDIFRRTIEGLPDRLLG